MIYFDVTKTSGSGHRSGLTRVNTRLRESLGALATAVTWDAKRGSFAGLPTDLQPADWLLTTELFSEDERPGFSNFLRHRPLKCAAIFHDAIPLKFPQIT